MTCSLGLHFSRGVRKPVLGVFRPGLTLTGLYVTTFFLFYLKKKKKRLVLQFNITQKMRHDFDHDQWRINVVLVYL